MVHFAIIDEKLLVSVPIRNYCPRFGLKNIITLGSNIYMIGEFSSTVFFMDCRSHTWHEGPGMQVAAKYNEVSVLDGKIYVVERCKVSVSSNLIQVFDPKTQIWECVASPSTGIRGRFGLNSLAIDGKLYLFGDKNLVYKPKEKTWDVVGFEMNFHWIPHDSFCVIDKVIIYYYNRHSRLLEWYDPEGSSWGILNGLEELLPKLPRVLVSRHVRLVDYGGKVAIFWEKEVRPLIGYNKITIWCAEIALERRNAQEIYGKIEWCNVVLTLPSSCSIDELNAVSIIV
ncbi:putative kelch-type beta propeller [Arabidopsis thaliana]|uniref:FKB95-like N-terminal Kelch domain-containing protein n=2 Tax=Arabidopsis TaxID=3701 RepID=A0A178US62_ARATH|nr:Kelch-type beta propeller [Arabidopsis thaliana x Arabidopsis arenosa]OAO96668.1 hypothetical protein AXX17_AT4G13220 [Arabidopsis thaliana]